MRAKRVVTVPLQPYFGFHWQVRFQGSNASGGRLVLLPSAFWAHGASKMASFALYFAVFQSLGPYDQKAADVWQKFVWDFQAFSQTFLELRFSLGNEEKDGKNLNSQTWPGTPRCPSPRHARPPDRRACFRQTRVAQAVLLPGALFHAGTFAFPPRAPRSHMCPLPHLGFSY